MKILAVVAIGTSLLGLAGCTTERLAAYEGYGPNNGGGYAPHHAGRHHRKPKKRMIRPPMQTEQPRVPDHDSGSGSGGKGSSGGNGGSGPGGGGWSG